MWPVSVAPERRSTIHFKSLDSAKSLFNSDSGDNANARRMTAPRMPASPPDKP
jgi:hypothetical protein